MLLEQFGWTPSLARQLASGIPGRVASANRDTFTVWTASGEILAGVTGNLRHTSDTWPVLGDWVVLRPDTPVITAVLTRRTTLSRKQPGKELREHILAANVDVVFLVSGLDGDFNERRIERFLVSAHQSGARPIILLNKADLAPTLNLDLPALVRRIERHNPGVPVLPVSALHDPHLGALTPLLSFGETAALLGSSGVGKSTLLNRLLGEQRQRTHSVRPGDDRGRHTTTTREMFLMPGNWVLMDLPGIRELQLWGPPDPMHQTFPDIDTLARQCRFRDCTHQGEPGCAVQTANLDQDRMANFLKMQRELAYLDRKTDTLASRETKAKWKAIERSIRSHPKRT